MKAHRFRLPLETRVFVILAVVDADNRPPAQAFIDDVVHAAHVFLHRPRHGAQFFRDVDDDVGEYRRDDKEQQRHPPVEVKEEDGERDDGNGFAQENGDGVGTGRHQLQRVVGEARDDAAGAVFIEIAHRQAQQLREHPPAQGVNHLLRQPVHATGGGIACRAAQHEAEEQQGGQTVNGAHVALGKAAIDQRLQYERHQRLGETIENRAARGEQHHPPMRADKGEQAQIAGAVVAVKHRGVLRRAARHKSGRAAGQKRESRCCGCRAPPASG